MAYPILAEQNTWYKSDIARPTFTQIDIKDTYTPTGTVSASWDASAAQDGSITVYVEGTKLTIAGNGSGKIALNTSAIKLFCGNTGSDAFNNVVTINGAELLDTSNVESFQNAFYGMNKLTSINVSNWDVSKCVDMTNMFAYCNVLQTLDVSNWDVSKVEAFSAMFAYCKALKSLDVSNWDTSSVTNMAYMFYHCYALTELDVSNWDVSNVENFSRMFNGASGYDALMKLKTLDVSNWNTSSATDMNHMFCGCELFTEIPVDNWDVSNVEDMGFMFWGCKNLKSINLSNWNTHKVWNFHHFFCHDYQLAEIKGIENLDLSSAKTLNGMLHGTKIPSLDVSKWNTPNLEDTAQFLESNYTIQEIIGLENLDTSNLKNCGQMFYGCSNLRVLNLSTFNTTGVNPDYIDVVREEKGYGMDGMFGDTYNKVGLLDRLEKIILGENFSFDGDGTCKIIAKIHNPSTEFIADTKGYWYNEETLEQYEAANIPTRTAGTYTCVPVDVLVKHTTLKDIADATRKLDNSTEKLTPSQIVETLNYVVEHDELYENGYNAGKQAEYDAFWDKLQDYGKRTNYMFAFAGLGWNNETFKPKYDIVITWGGASRVFSSATFSGSLKEHFNNMGIKFDVSQATNLAYAFENLATITEVPDLDCSNCLNLNNTFYGCPALTDVKIKLTEKTTSFAYTFYNCTALKNLTIDGTIAVDIDLHWSPLSKESIISVLGALSPSATGKTVTFNATAAAAAFSETQWNSIKNAYSNWTIKTA